MAARLKKLTLRGFKTIRELNDFELGPLTVLIGPNGAGKSNFVSFFRLLSWALGTRDGLQTRIGEEGGASALLHDGPEVTPELTVGLLIETESGDNEYRFSLRFAAGDTLIFSDEAFRFSRRKIPGVPPEGDKWGVADWTSKGGGHREPRLLEAAEGGNPTARVIRNLLYGFKVFQFHNTSQTARIRTKWHENDGRWLREDGANLAPFLFRLREH
ncbi:MAG: AAA family ATPase, partial [bacterium]|nr:AAA family ATPase [bacterium]